MLTNLAEPSRTQKREAKDHEFSDHRNNGLTACPVEFLALDANADTPWINPRTGKGWTDKQEAVIALVMAAESVPRLEAIRRMRRRVDSKRGFYIDRTERPYRRPESVPRQMTTAMKKFVHRYRVKTMWTGTEYVAPGKFGEIADFYQDGDGAVLRLRLLAAPRGSGRHDAALRIRGHRAQAAAMVLHQRAGPESIYLFDPLNHDHCRLAIQLVRPRIRRRRNLSPEQREALAARMAGVRAAKAVASRTDAQAVLNGGSCPRPLV